MNFFKFDEIQTIGDKEKKQYVNIFIEYGDNLSDGVFSFGMRWILLAKIKVQLGLEDDHESMIIKKVEQLQEYKNLILYIDQTKNENSFVIRFVMYKKDLKFDEVYDLFVQNNKIDGNQIDRNFNFKLDEDGIFLDNLSIYHNDKSLSSRNVPIEHDKKYYSVTDSKREKYKKAGICVDDPDVIEEIKRVEKRINREPKREMVTREIIGKDGVKKLVPTGEYKVYC